MGFGKWGGGDLTKKLKKIFELKFLQSLSSLTPLTDFYEYITNIIINTYEKVWARFWERLSIL